MNIHRNGRLVVASPTEEASIAAHQARVEADHLQLQIAARVLELRQEAADLIDASAGIDTALPPEHRVRELVLLNATFSDLLDRARGRPLSGPEQATLAGLRAVFDGAKAIRAAEAAARGEAASATTPGALRGVQGVAARLP